MHNTTSTLNFRICVPDIYLVSMCKIGLFCYDLMAAAKGTAAVKTGMQYGKVRTDARF